MQYNAFEFGDLFNPKSLLCKVDNVMRSTQKHADVVGPDGDGEVRRKNGAVLQGFSDYIREQVLSKVGTFKTCTSLDSSRSFKLWSIQNM